MHKHIYARTHTHDQALHKIYVTEWDFRGLNVTVADAVDKDDGNDGVDDVGQLLFSSMIEMVSLDTFNGHLST